MRCHDYCGFHTTSLPAVCIADIGDVWCAPMNNIEHIMDAIEEQRSLNNKHFMRMWRLAFKHAPEEAREIQREIRRGDLIISELNKQLCE